MECIEINWSVTFGTEASKPECIEINQSVTLGTAASQVECIEINQVGYTWYSGQSGGVYRD